MPRARTILDEFRLEQYEVTPRVIPVASPAVGVDWSVVVPGGVVWQIQAITSTIQTSAVVATRNVALTLTDGSNLYYRYGSSVSTAASATRRYMWIRSLGFDGGASGGLGTHSPCPSFPLPGGHILSGVTQNMDAGDQWSLIVLYVIEYDPLNIPAELEET